MSFKRDSLLCGLFLFAVLWASNLLADEQLFRVGMILPLSGPTAGIGNAMKNSVDLARSDRPDLFKNVEFIYKDVKSDGKSVVSAYHILREIVKVDLIYMWGNSSCKTLASIVDILSFPSIGHCSNSKALAGRQYFVSFVNRDDEYMKVLADYLAFRGMKNLGILVSASPIVEGLSDAFERNLSEGQSVQIIEKLAAKEGASSRAVTAKLKKENYDAVGTFLFGSQLSVFYKRKAELGLEFPSFGAFLMDSSVEVEASQGGMEGVVFPGISLRRSFVDRYKSRFGNEGFLGSAAQVYEFAIMMGRLFGKEEARLSPEEIMERIKSVRSDPGIATGPYYYRESEATGGYFQFPIVMKKIVNGQFEEM